jgi:outer membrane lipoprotein-sorting protein
MRIAILSIVALFLTPLSYVAAQGATAKPETSDPKARAILDKVKKQYDGYQSLETGFTLTIKLAEQPKEEVQKGKMYQKGDKFRAEMDNHIIFGDNTTIWHKEGNKVNIMNATKKSNDGFMSPKDLLNIYQGKDYIYALYGETADGWSKKAMIINFKPVNRRSEYTQIRVAIDSKTNQIVSATAFGRDQSRTKLAFDQPSVNKKYAADFFVFDKSKYPNIKVEDLRTD